MDYKIRPYKSSDRKQLLYLVRGLREHLTTLNPQRKKEINEHFYDYYLERIKVELQKNCGCVYMAFEKEHAVGYIYGVVKNQSREEQYEFIPTKIGEIMDLFVRAEYRKNGIGKELINAAEIFFRKENCDIVSLTVLHNNAHSLQYYSKINFQTDAVEMIKIINKS